MKIYVITGTSGSYSDQSWWVVAYKRTEAEAKELVATLEATESGFSGDA